VPRESAPLEMIAGRRRHSESKIRGLME